MGFSYRKRKKKKFGHVNVAYSEGNGLSGSVYLQLGESITHNLGSIGGKRKRKPKTTVRLGKGLKFTIPW